MVDFLPKPFVKKASRSGLATLLFISLWFSPETILAQQGAIVARHSITVGFFVDSFDSGQPGIMSDANGQYNSSIFSGDRGDVTTLGGSDSSVIVGNANIYGKLHTGTNCSVLVDTNGSVGTHLWAASHYGLEPGYVLQDANLVFPDTSPPKGVFLPPEANYSLSNSTGTIVSKGLIVTNSCPDPLPPDGVQTNFGLVLSSTLPNPLPPPPILTNSFFTNSAILPNPVPTYIRTNYVTASTTSSWYPTNGTYIGGVATNISHGKTVYTYNLIISTSYSYQIFSYYYFAPEFSYYQLETNVIAVVPGIYNYVFFAGITNRIHSLGSGTNVVIGNPAMPGEPATLILDGGLTGQEHFVLLGGASLDIYCGGTSCTLTTNVSFVPYGYATNFFVCCSTNVTSLSLSGHGTFLGTVIAPNALATLQADISSRLDYAGMLLVDSLSVTGGVAFHYDQNMTPQFPPVIVQQPTNQLVAAGQDVSLSVGAAAPGLVVYNWLKAQPDGSQLPVALSFTNALPFPSIQLSDGGTYSVIVSNGFSCVTSAPVTLTMVAVDPPQTTLLPGQNAQFTVLANPPEPLSYQWSFATNTLVDETNSSLSLDAVTNDQAGNYVVSVTDTNGLTTTASASLFVQNTPAATLNSFLSANSNTFAFQLTGISGFTYVVQASTNLTDWIPVGTNVSPFTFTDTESQEFPQRYYRAVWSP